MSAIESMAGDDYESESGDVGSDGLLESDSDQLEHVRETGEPLDHPVDAQVNDDPTRRRIVGYRRGVLSWLWRKIRPLIWPELTSEEIAEMDDKKRAKLLERALEDDTNTAAEIISNSLAGLRLCEFAQIEGKIEIKKQVTFDFALPMEDAIWLHVDTHPQQWPFGLNSQTLLDPANVNHISRSVGRHIAVRNNEEAGIFFVVERASGRMGIPNHVQLSDAWSRTPATADLYTIPIGITTNRRYVYDSIVHWPHAIVAGGTNSGKSNFLNVLICSLLRQNTPDTVKFLLFDPKQGLEFSFYEGIPHLLSTPQVPGGIVYDPDLAVPTLKWLLDFGRDRMETIKKAGYKNIAGYNSHRMNKMARVIVVIDEWADIRRDKKGGPEAEDQLCRSTAILRAAGIHIILCTQVPSKQVVSMDIRVNLPTKVAFDMPDQYASMAVLGNMDAFGLAIPGRCIFRSSNTKDPRAIQTPIITDHMVEQVVKDAKAGIRTVIKKGHDVTLMEMFRWALAENNGVLAYKTLYTHFASRGITCEEIRVEVVKSNDKEFMIDDVQYVVRRVGKNGGYRLIAVQSGAK